jgi:hypothetical protein
MPFSHNPESSSRIGLSNKVRKGWAESMVDVRSAYWSCNPKGRARWETQEGNC